MISKKKWKKPQLIILVREKPEESVLQACKILAEGAIGPYVNMCLGIYNFSCHGPNGTS